MDVARRPCPEIPQGLVKTEIFVGDSVQTISFTSIATYFLPI